MLKSQNKALQKCPTAPVMRFKYQTLHICHQNGDMSRIQVVCSDGIIGDLRTWAAVCQQLSKYRRCGNAFRQTRSAALMTSSEGLRNQTTTILAFELLSLKGKVEGGVNNCSSTGNLINHRVISSLLDAYFDKYANALRQLQCHRVWIFLFGLNVLSIRTILNMKKSH